MMKLFRNSGHCNNEVKKSFTLLEVVLYLAIASTVVGIVAALLVGTLQSRERSLAISEVESQGIHLLRIISSTIRNAKSITAPSRNSTGASLQVSVFDATKSPTVFDVVDTMIRIKEGNSPTIELNNSHVTVSNLTFQNLSRTTENDLIKVKFTLESTSTVSDANYTQIFTTTLSTR